MITTKQGTKIQLNTIEEAIADIKQGKVIIVVDDEDRENEGDFVAAAENITPEIINFMATHGRGLICTPITESRCKELQLEMMVGNNTDPMETAFTISIDLKGHGVTTGISAKDRAKTVKALVDPSIKPFDLSRPGHIFPLKAKDGGVLRRTGHTEAAIDFARLAGLKPAGAIVEIMNEDGTMARLPELKEIAKRFNLKIITIEALIAYRMQHETLIEEVVEVIVTPVFNHETFDKLLRKYVTSSGKVNYKGIKSESGKLETYIKELQTEYANIDSWSKNKKLAFWINVYNAHTIKLIVDKASKKKMEKSFMKGKGLLKKLNMKEIEENFKIANLIQMLMHFFLIR